MKLFLLIVFVVVSAHGLTREERGTICVIKHAKCIWLNDYLSKPHGFPLHSSVCHQHPCKPDVLCHNGRLTPNTLIHLWDTLHISLETTRPATLAVSYGNSSRIALSDQSTSHNISTHLRLQPFGTHCVAVKRVGPGSSNSKEDTTHYTINARLELWPLYPVLMAMGLCLLFTAPSLSRNVPLLYGTGITLGILASVLILLYVLSRYVPGKNFMGLGFLVGGYTVVGSIGYWILTNMAEAIMEYWQYMLGYMITAGLISFAVIYRWGGVSDPRTLNLVQWSSQLAGLVLIYMSTPSSVASFVMVLLALASYSIPLRSLNLVFPFYIFKVPEGTIPSGTSLIKKQHLNWWHPHMLLYWLLKLLLSPLCQCMKVLFKRPMTVPARQHLTAEEYEEQGKAVTARELERLKNFCVANKDVTSNLRDSSRTKLQKFVSGHGDHVTEEEKVNHEWTFMEESDSETEASLSSKQSPSPQRSSPPHPRPTPPGPRSSPLRYHYTAPANLASRHRRV